LKWRTLSVRLDLDQRGGRLTLACWFKLGQLGADAVLQLERAKEAAKKV